MRLWELFSDLDEKSLPAVERGPAANIVERLIQKSKSAGITVIEAEDLLRRGRDKFAAKAPK
jgi:hypothetical protein